MLILGLGTSTYMVAVCSPDQPDSVTFSLTVLIALAFTSFLLRQRVMDEFKDRGHDDLNYPNRPVQRGAISIKNLVGLGIAAFLLEISAVISIAAISSHWQSIYYYLPVIAFSLLTAREFFIPNWLNKHFTLYYLTHQLIFVFFILWGVSIFETSGELRIAAGSISFILMMASLEIMRKYEIRTNSAGEVVRDTYLAVWGRTQTNLVLALGVAISGVSFGLFESATLSIIGLISGLIIVGVRKSERAVQAATIGGFFVLGLVAYFS